MGEYGAEPRRGARTRRFGPAERMAPGCVVATLCRTLDRFTEDTGIAVNSELPDVACDQRGQDPPASFTFSTSAAIIRSSGPGSGVSSSSCPEGSGPRTAPVSTEAMTPPTRTTVTRL